MSNIEGNNDTLFFDINVQKRQFLAIFKQFNLTITRAYVIHNKEGNNDTLFFLPKCLNKTIFDNFQTMCSM